MEALFPPIVDKHHDCQSPKCGKQNTIIKLQLHVGWACIIQSQHLQCRVLTYIFVVVVFFLLPQIISVKKQSWAWIHSHKLLCQGVICSQLPALSVLIEMDEGRWFAGVIVLCCLKWCWMSFTDEQWGREEREGFSKGTADHTDLV